MIDFRYHLVSLISVFLALAVGIVLGAGPLQESIGDTLTDQIDVLRADRDQLRIDIAERTMDLEDREAWIVDVGEQLVEDSLAGRDVALLVLPGATDDDVAAVADQLEAAGAGEASRARLTEAWTTTEPGYRQTFSQQLAGYLDPAPDAEASSDEVLATAVGQMLAGGAEAEVLRELLAGGDEPFVAVDGDIVPASALVVVGPRPEPVVPVEPAASATPTEEGDDVEDPAWARVVAAFATALPTVTVGSGAELILAIREAGIPTSTVDSIGELPAAITVPLAIAAELNGVHGRYGFAPSAESPVPVIVPAPPLVAPEEPAEPTADATAGADG